MADDEDGVGMFFVVVFFSLRLYLIALSNMSILLPTCFFSFHSFLFNPYLIHFKISPDPLLRALPHLRVSNVPPPPGVG